jgi:hypothetical protein
MYAARQGAIDAGRALVDLHADVTAVALPQTDVPLKPEDREAFAHGVGTTALVYAIINVHYDFAALLLEHGADPNISDIAGMARSMRPSTWPACSGRRAGRRRSCSIVSTAPIWSG